MCERGDVTLDLITVVETEILERVDRRVERPRRLVGPESNCRAIQLSREPLVRRGVDARVLVRLSAKREHLQIHDPRRRALDDVAVERRNAVDHVQTETVKTSDICCYMSLFIFGI